MTHMCDELAAVPMWCLGDRERTGTESRQKELHWNLK